MPPLHCLDTADNLCVLTCAYRFMTRADISIKVSKRKETLHYKGLKTTILLSVRAQIQYTQVK